MKQEILNLARAISDNSRPIGWVKQGAVRGTDSCKVVSKAAMNINRIVSDEADRICGNLPVFVGSGNSAVYNQRRAEALGVWLDNMSVVLNDSQQGPYGPVGTTGYGVTVSSDLQRQVIFSESMRAFRRRLAPAAAFAHVWNSVPLEGTDVIDVPYYPLYTAPSKRYTQSQGYQFGGTDQAQRRQIQVGGVGPDTKVPGQDRAYQAMTWSAYVLRRQPWVNTIKLVVMRAEQLAVDIFNDIVTTHVVKANFGNAVWSGLPGAFDENVVAAIAGACKKTDWPDNSRSLVIGTDYWVNLASQPYVKAFLNIGDDATIREGRIGGLYGFDDTIQNPRIPVTADGNLIGWACYPSAVGVATSPILPGPGELRNMLSYDLTVDEQTGMSFEYKHWGEPWNSADREIIECNYGSAPIEFAALKRLVANGV